jgi:hypothetical protein
MLTLKKDKRIHVPIHMQSTKLYNQILARHVLTEVKGKVSKLVAKVGQRTPCLVTHAMFGSFNGATVRGCRNPGIFVLMYLQQCEP